MKARILTAKADVSLLSLTKGKLYDVHNLKEYDSEVFFDVIDDENKKFRCILKGDGIIQGDWEFVYPKFVEAPCDWKHGKKGQMFKVEKPDITSFRIIVEKNKELYCLWKSCDFLNFGDWIERWDSDSIEILSDEVSSEYPKYVEAPCDSKPERLYSFKKGKLYETLNCTITSFNVRDDGGKKLLCLWEGCAHLNHENIDWIKRWDLQYVTKDTISRINNKIDGPLNKIAKRPIVEGQWYKFGALYTRYAKASKGFVNSSEKFYYSESIADRFSKNNPDQTVKEYLSEKGTIHKDFLIGEATLEEIQEYLPDGHPDKMQQFAVGDYIIYNGTKKNGKWYNYFGKYGLMPGDAGIIISALSGADDYFVKDVIRGTFQSGILNSKDLRKTDKQTYEKISQAMLERNKPKKGDYIRYLGTKSTGKSWESSTFGRLGVEAGDVGIIFSVVGDTYFTKDMFRDDNDYSTLLAQDFIVISEQEYDQGSSRMLERMKQKELSKITEGYVKGIDTSSFREKYPVQYKNIVNTPEIAKPNGLVEKHRKQRNFKPSTIESINVKLKIKKS